MSASEAVEYALCCHPATPAIAARRVVVQVGRSATHWQLVYRFAGDADRIVWPSMSASGFAEGLWRTTCAELFARHRAADAYREFNFSPDGRWAIFDFAGERQRVGVIDAPELAPRIQARRAAMVCELMVDLPAMLWPAGGRQCGFCAVVEEVDRRSSYWALAHAADRPDFHRSTTFGCNLTDDD